jgi:steroid 5-alpha reductase family enzyme
VSGHLIEQSLLVAGASLAVAVAAMTITALVARRLGRVNVVDVTWGLALVGVALVCAAISPTWEAWLVLGLVAVWGLRLSWHILVRSRGEAEDPRYVEMLDGGGFEVAIRKVFVVQGAAVWLVSLPLQAPAVTDLTSTWPVALGLVVWGIGLTFEAVGDAQLASYRARPRNQRPSVLDTGLWAWTRHPNYFGDACIWWGIWLVGAVSAGWLPALLTVVAPVTMTIFLRNVTGAKLLEKTMSQRPGWDQYAARVPLFFPRPPRD